MNNGALSEEEIKKILDSVKDIINISQSGSRIQVVSTSNDNEKNKKSGGIIPNKSERESYLGDFINLEEFLEALSSYLSNSGRGDISTFEKKGKVPIDFVAIERVLQEYASVYLEKNNESKTSADFYGVYTSKEGSYSKKRSGSIITPGNRPVKEGTYISENAARQIVNGIVNNNSEPVIQPPDSGSTREPESIISSPAVEPDDTPNIEVPSSDDIKKAVDDIDKQKPEISTFKRKKKSNSRLKKIAAAIALTLGIAVSIFVSNVLAPYQFTESELPVPEPTPIVSVEPDHHREKDFRIRIGDVVVVSSGESYDHTSQAVDGISGVIGENPYREAGKYTVDAIAIINPTNNQIMSYSDDFDGNMMDMLQDIGCTMDDVESGKVVVRYNVSEGENPDLDRTNAAGWMTYNPKDYHPINNVTQGPLNQGPNQIKGGRS